MTLPTTARLLATKTRDVKPGQYGYLWMGQYHFLFIFMMVPGIPYFTDSVFHVYSAIVNINYIIMHAMALFRPRGQMLLSYICYI